MQVSEDKMLCALGLQSTTGQALAIGDIVGFSNLQKGQADIAMKLGNINEHSAEVDKLTGVDYREDEGAILIRNARAEMKCKVLEILHLKEIESENLVYLRVLDLRENAGKSPLMSDLEF